MGTPATAGTAPPLPFEVQRLIIRQSSDTPTLLALARVSRAYYFEVIPVLYQHVTISETAATKTPGKALDHLLGSSVHLRHLRTFFCARSALLQGHASRRHGAELWDAVMTRCHKLQCAAWVRAAADYYVGLTAEMVRVVDAPHPSFACCCEKGTEFEWHLYGDLHAEMVARLAAAPMRLTGVHLTVLPGGTQASVDKIETILPTLLEAVPKLRFVQIYVGYNMLEFGSRTRRMDRARAFHALFRRLQEHTKRFPELKIRSSPSAHVFSTSIDIMDENLPAMVKVDFNAALKDAPAGSSEPEL